MSGAAVNEMAGEPAGEMDGELAERSVGELVGRVRPLDADAMRRARDRQRSLTKPPGSLGRLEDISVQLAGAFGSATPKVRGKAVIVAAGDHGVVAQGVSAYPQEVTAQMVLNFLSGGAAVSVMSRLVGARQIIVNAGVAGDLPPHPDLLTLGVGKGTADISQGPAMTRADAARCVMFGARVAMDAAVAGADLIAAGDMGIGNTTASAAVAAAVTGASAQDATGAGAGRTADELARKAAVVAAALRVNAPDGADGLDTLAKVGGFEIGALAGAALGAAAARRIVIADGFISGAAMLIANALCPLAREYMIASHRSAERGHGVVLSHLNLTPLLELDMRLGEGSGAVLAMPIVEAAAATLSEMATFGEAGVSDRDDD